VSANGSVQAPVDERNRRQDVERVLFGDISVNLRRVPGRITERPEQPLDHVQSGLLAALAFRRQRIEGEQRGKPALPIASASVRGDGSTADERARLNRQNQSAVIACLAKPCRTSRNQPVLRCFADEPAAEIVQCGEPHP